METHLGQGRDGLGDAPGEEAAVHGEGAASGHLHLVGHPHDERAHPAHLFLEKARGLVEAVAAQAVRAHELGKVAGLVHGGAAPGTHLVEVHGDAASRELPGRLAARETGPHDRHALAHRASIALATRPAARRASVARASRASWSDGQAASRLKWQASLAQKTTLPSFFVSFSRRKGRPQSGQGSGMGLW